MNFKEIIIKARRSSLMKFYYLVILNLFVFCISGCYSQVSSKVDEDVSFLFKTDLDTSYYNKGQHIELKQILPKTDDMFQLSIDDRNIIQRSQYSLNQRIKILYEYLSFRGDTSISNKRYQFKPAYYMERPVDVNGFTIQIEALYSFTRMLTIGYPPIKPVIINRITGEKLNTNPIVVNEVFDIYFNWFRINKKSGFKNFILPLDGTPYCWLGEDKGMEPYLKKSL